MENVRLISGTASELATLLQQIAAEHGEQQVVISVFRPNSIGPSPSTAINSLLVGFDWDHGVVLIQPESTLMEVSEETQKQILKEGRMTYDKYKEFTALKKRIAELEEQLKDRR